MWHAWGDSCETSIVLAIVSLCQLVCQARPVRHLTKMLQPRSATPAWTPRPASPHELTPLSPGYTHMHVAWVRPGPELPSSAYCVDSCCVVCGLSFQIRRPFWGERAGTWSGAHGQGRRPVWRAERIGGRGGLAKVQTIEDRSTGTAGRPGRRGAPIVHIG